MKPKRSKKSSAGNCLSDYVRKYEEPVQLPKESPLSSESSFREHDYLVMLSDLSSVSGKKFGSKHFVL